MVNMGCGRVGVAEANGRSPEVRTRRAMAGRVVGKGRVADRPCLVGCGAKDLVLGKILVRRGQSVVRQADS
jgi:hypothetical protein